MTFPGAPSIYYGDEIGMAGGHDPRQPRGLPWDRRDDWDTDLLHEFQRMIALRNDRPRAASRLVPFLHAEDEVVAYVRELGDETSWSPSTSARQRAGRPAASGSHLAEGRSSTRYGPSPARSRAG